MTAKTTTVGADVLDGAAYYNRQMLRYYDRLVWVTCRYFWGCDKHEILRRYQAAIGARHLEIGVGSGYCLENSLFPVPEPEITLVDLNPHTLDFAGRRIAHLRQRRIVANALEPLESVGVPANAFDSVAVNLLLHCIPGDIPKKEAVLVNAATAAVPGGKVVGSTVLAHGVQVSRRGRWLMKTFNTKGVFHNADDRLSDLESTLDKIFDEHILEVRGSMALFTATVG
ncbi:MAG: class I SAM-dependent methyltransferase [Pseudonocardiaceae bacterium]